MLRQDTEPLRQLPFGFGRGTPRELLGQMFRSAKVILGRGKTVPQNRTNATDAHGSSEKNGEHRFAPLDNSLSKHCEQVYQSLRQAVNGSTSLSRVVGVTSCYDSEGVTTVVSQLARAAAGGVRRTLVVDANFPSPALHERFAVPLRPGLAEAMSGALSWDEAIVPVSGMGVVVMPAGVAAPTQGSFDAERLRNLIRYAEDNYEFTLVDLPPLCHSADMFSLYGLLHGVLLVVESERVRWPVAKRFVSDLQRSGANLLGAVVNRRRQHIPRWLYRTL